VNFDGMIEREEDRKFRQLLPGSSWRELRQGTTYFNTGRLRDGRNGDDGDVYSLGDRTFDQSRVSAGTTSRRD